MDANSKLGRNYIPNDPHNQSQNGKILANIIKKHNLIVVNGLPLCQGVITRRRETIDGIEESAINFVLMSSDLLNYIDSMIIDEDRKHVLTKIMETNKGQTKSTKIQKK